MSPRTGKDVLTDAKDLPMNEKLQILDKEIRRLHKACEDAGYSPDKIREVASPVLKTARKGEMKRALRIGIYVAIFAIVCYAGYKFEPTNYAGRVIWKKTMVYWVLPYYDWTWVYNSECLLENPYYEPILDEMTEDNCTCTDLKSLTPVSNMDTDEMTELIYDMIPSIIEDATINWKAIVDDVDLDTFIKIFATNEKTMVVNGKSQTGYYRSTKPVAKNVTNATAFAKYIYQEGIEGRKPNFSVQWSNNGHSSYKIMHDFYVKPYFLPSMCEALRDHSYVTLARQQNRTKLYGLQLKPRGNDLGIWMAQVVGDNEIVLSPVPLCAKICSKIRFVLKRGQILNIPLGLYDIQHRPNTTEAVAIAVGYEFQ